ncbi:M57 family metalloprotease [Nonlabens xiamenensis]|uniref:M57 family metalloprotease n=1 Tax=Nonlabens xiamenensis TaxID=2341043 RepID=UPI000F60DE5F|nr:M57 family metalloprotease [Nonlabens xiamenensis]
MKKSFFKLSLLGLSIAAITFTSCEADQEIAPVEEQSKKLELAQAHAEKIGYKPSDVQIQEFFYPDGTSSEKLILQDDVALSEEDFYALQTVDQLAKQYRTNNLVTGSNRTIDILGYNANNQYGLSSKAQTGLRWAVDNYNRLSGVSLTFNLSFGTNTGAADMVVYDTSFSTNRSGGVAGFPSSGRPHKWVQIYNLENFTTNVNEHVICHEIGHSIGFRHSDWFSRQSCGETGESAGFDGAVHVAGTPTGWDSTSLMNACFSASTGGEFNGNDVTALQNMY